MVVLTQTTHYSPFSLRSLSLFQWVNKRRHVLWKERKSFCRTFECVHSVFIIFSQKEKAGTVEKVVKFVVCIVENSLRVGHKLFFWSGPQIKSVASHSSLSHIATAAAALLLLHSHRCRRSAFSSPPSCRYWFFFFTATPSSSPLLLLVLLLLFYFFFFFFCAIWVWWFIYIYIYIIYIFCIRVWWFFCFFVFWYNDSYMFDVFGI